MKLEIDVKQALVVTGCVTAGMAIGFGLSKLMLKKAKKELRAEVIDDEKIKIKYEIKNEIKDSININEIKNDIKKQLEDSIIEDTIKEMNVKIEDTFKKMDAKMEDICNKNCNFMAKVETRLGKYEKTLKKIESDVLDADARVGKLVNNAIRTMAGVVVKRGDDDED